MYAKDQVPLLIEMEKADAALDKAIESGDPQLGMSTETYVRICTCTFVCLQK